MYDYNFEERLTQKRLILLLLSIVIPNETAILKDIYKKKRELEVEEYHKGAQDISEQNGWILDGFKNTCIQINALYPNFIMYSIDYEFSDEKKVVHTYALVTGCGWRWRAWRGDAPRGLDVINHVFKYWTNRQPALGSTFKIEYNDNRTYKELNDKITEFRRCEDLLNDSSEPNLLYLDVKEINEDFGIRVNDQLCIECY
jgi:hypothetical protein